MAGGGLPQRAGEPAPGAGRRSDARRGRIRALHCRRLTARARPDPFWAGTRRIDRAQHARPARRAVPRRQGPGAAKSRSPAGSAMAEASLSARRARWSVSITCERACSSLARPGCRYARSDRRSSPSGRAVRCLPARGSAGRCSNGRLGDSPLHLAAAGGRIVGKRICASIALGMRLGKPASPIIFDTSTLTGSFVGSGISGGVQRRAARRSATSRC